MALKTSHRNTLAALGFLAPNFIGFFLFVAFPVLFSVVIVLTNWSLKPAVETRFVGLENVWRLVAFRPIAGAEVSGGLGWLLGFLGAYTGLAAGVLLAFMGLGRKWPGLRLGGVCGLGGGLLLIALAFLQQGGGGIGVGVGGVLLGLTILLASFFFLTDEEATWRGRGAAGPVLVLVSLAAMYVLRGAFLRRWEPLDPQFWYYFYNTLYLMFAIPVSIAGSLILALVLSQPLLKTRARGRVAVSFGLAACAVVGGVILWSLGRRDTAVFWVTFWGIATLGIGAGAVSFRTLFYLPSFTAGIAVMLLWKHMFNPTFGPINEGLRLVFGLFGLDASTPNWLNDPNWAKPALMLMGFWITVGGANMLLYLAGLSNIPQDLYEAASIDGASRCQAFWNVTWPQLAPTTFFIVIINTIAGLQGGFEQARVMTNGGPAGSTKTLAYYVYEKAFQELSMGYGAAIAWVLFAIVFALTAINWRFGNRYVNY
jgi:multiple sugar transport system permease protein